MAIQIAGGKSKVAVYGGEPTAIPAAVLPDPVVTATNIPRGVRFEWTCAWNTSYWVYYEYRFVVNGVLKPGPGATDYYETHNNGVIYWLTVAEADADIDMTVDIYVQVREKGGGTNPLGERTAQGTPRPYNAGPDTSGDDKDFDDNSILIAKSGPSLDAQIFTSAARSLADTSDGGGKFAAIQANADNTLLNTAGDTTLVDGAVAAVVRGNAALGQIAHAKIDGDLPGGIAGGLTLENTLDSQVKVNARLSVAEKTALDAYKTTDGLHDLLTTGRMPTLGEIGIGNVENLSASQILNTMTVGQIQASGLSAPDINAILTDGSNAPAILRNANMKLSNDGRLTGGSDLGQVTAEGLGLGAFKNQTADSILKHLDIPRVKATGITLDDIPHGATYRKVSVGEKSAIMAEEQLWTGYVVNTAARAVYTPNVYTNNAWRDTIVWYYLHSAGNHMIQVSLLANTDILNVNLDEMRIAMYAKDMATLIGTGVAVSMTVANPLYTVVTAEYDATGLPFDVDYMYFISVQFLANAADLGHTIRFYEGILRVTK